MKKKVTLQEFQNRIKQHFPEESFTILSYQSLGKPAIIQCEKCGKQIQINQAGNFLAKNKRYGCVNCHGFWREREEKLKAIKKRYDIISVAVKDTHTHYTIRCKQCGHQRTSTLHNLYKSLLCGCETGVYRGRAKEEFVAAVNEATLDDFSLVGDYINQTTPVLLRHNACGFIIRSWPHDAVNGKISCPHCHRNQSRGERVIAKYLLKQNIPFQQEKILAPSRQRFDFYLENEKCKIAIEYNGEQHYAETNFFVARLEQIQTNDRKKRQYCKDNNIILYEIPYTVRYTDIPAILDGILCRFNDYPYGVDSSESKSCLSVDITDKDIVSSE